MTTVATALELLDRWCEGERRRLPRLLVFAAHPDDDVLGLGGRLERVAGAIDVAIVSDGAPDSPEYYRSLGFASREGYARARRAEAAAALRRAGVPEGHLHELGVVDQTVARHLDGVSSMAMRLIARLAPDAVMTHAYEGGHPDHDATACAVHTALHELARAGAEVPALLEFASYHRQGPRLAFGEFIAGGPMPVRRMAIDVEARARKLELLELHATQAHVWRDFPLDHEDFRVAPRYDFRRPPAAPFHYDDVDWGLSGKQFLEQVRRCLSQRNIEEAI
jgi:LmbE family N-acetylglucosaminyl deacetylase